jgi:hypothetical protein
MNRIRKITIGNYEFGMSYQKNQSFKSKDGSITIVEISLDMEYLTKFNIDKYDIYAKGMDGEAKIWKSFIRQKILVEFEF